eukprot:scaffold2044_cov202-Prasinococcus_capsulatus_cf.AAC.6
MRRGRPRRYNARGSSSPNFGMEHAPCGTWAVRMTGSHLLACWHVPDRCVHPCHETHARIECPMASKMECTTDSGRSGAVVTQGCQPSDTGDHDSRLPSEPRSCDCRLALLAWQGQAIQTTTSKDRNAQDAGSVAQNQSRSSQGRHHSIRERRRRTIGKAALASTSNRPSIPPSTYALAGPLVLGADWRATLSSMASTWACVITNFLGAFTQPSLAIMWSVSSRF